MSTRKSAIRPVTFVVSILMFLVVVGLSSNQVFADGEGIDRIVPSDSPVGSGLFAVYAVINHDSGFDYTVEVNNESGSADIIRKLSGSSSGDLDNVGPTKEVNSLSPVNLCFTDESLRVELEALGFDFDDLLNGTADSHDIGECVNEVVLVVLLCDDLGSFDITFSNQDENDDSQATELECRGEPDNAEITLSQSKVEIIPQPDSTDVTTITVEIFDSNGSPALPGDDVLFLTDNCLLDDGVNPQAVSVSVVSLADEGDTIAEVDLDCSNSSSEPRPATITILIDKAGHDIVMDIAVIVIGPPVPDGLTAVASPENLVCGEKSEILITVQDAIGQNVSDNTPLEVVTNFGGVLGGTGAVALGEGNVTPLSSTTVKTIDGLATVFLITSDTHEGDYEVLITTGGHVSEGLLEIVDGPPFSAQVTVGCTNSGGVTLPTVLPTVTAPATGSGNSITPPSTGDAGVASGTSASSFLLIASTAIIALVGITSLKFFRR